MVPGAAGIYAPVSFAVAGLIAGVSALAYVELSARYAEHPRGCAGAAGLAFWQALHRRRCSDGPGGYAVSAATIARGVVGYLSVLLPAPDWTAPILLVAGLGALAAGGYRPRVGPA